MMIIPAIGRTIRRVKWSPEMEPLRFFAPCIPAALLDARHEGNNNRRLRNMNSFALPVGW